MDCSAGFAAAPSAQAVADSRFGDDMTGTGRVNLDLAPQV